MYTGVEKKPGTRHEKKEVPRRTGGWNLAPDHRSTPERLSSESRLAAGLTSDARGPVVTVGSHRFDSHP